MPYYKGVIDELLAKGHDADAKQVARKLLSLRDLLDEKVPERNVLSSLLLATWNIREFGADDKFGKRLDESLLYIAEIISHFDLVAVQEVNENLGNLQELVRLLGGWWEYLVTDVTLGTSGNRERIAFIYDGRKVRFDRLAGELALPAVKKKPVVQPARSPFICAFKAGWRRLSLCSVHIFFGQSKPNDPRRVEEIRAISDALAKRNANRQNISDGEPESVVLLGDFNIFDVKNDKTAKALTSNQFVIPKALTVPAEKRLVKDGVGSNLARSKHFDQIAFHDPKGRLKASKGGVFDFQQVIYGPKDVQDYVGAMKRSAPEKFQKVAEDPKKRDKFYLQWRTFQLSDHLPMWVELQTDFANSYLGSVLRGRKPSRAANQQRKKAEATSPVTTPPPIASKPAGANGKPAAKKAGKVTAKAAKAKAARKPRKKAA
jgi:endonuclease/exonuclease/phosphatase family metal-dependent hydrolase